jgi:two-component system sensor histidine kinase RegB
MTLAPALDASRAPLRVHWLVRLRWATIAAQVASIVGVKFLLRAPFPLPPLLAIVGLLTAVNLVLERFLRRGRQLSDGAIALHLLLDIAALTGLLIWTGGAMNPFTTLYLLQVALAAILVAHRWSLVVTVGAVVAFGGLLLARPEAIHVWHSGAMFLLHVRGMWVAFALTAGCLWFFVERVSAALRRREDELAAARLQAERAARLAALATLAAGTAHELNTPLGSVAILAAELSDTLAAHPDARAQADRIRAEVRRCTQILTRLRSHEDPLAARERVELAPWLQDVVRRWRAQTGVPPVPVDVAAEARTGAVRMDAAALRQAVHNLLDNARRATDGAPDAIAVELRRMDDGGFVVGVLDRGVGIAPAALLRVREPFFTTREPGDGMGLGLFLVEAAVTRHGGALTIVSEPRATCVRFTLPAATGAPP